MNAKLLPSKVLEDSKARVEIAEREMGAVAAQILTRAQLVSRNVMQGVDCRDILRQLQQLSIRGDGLQAEMVWNYTLIREMEKELASDADH